MTQPLRSIPITGTSTLLWGSPSLCSASVLSSSWILHLDFSLDIGTTPSSPGGFHPQALTDPYVSLSTHTARVISPLMQHKQRGPTLRLLPSLVGQTVRPDDPTPSLHPHYRNFNATTSWSAPVPRVGTLTLAGSARLGFSLSIGATGSHVPHKSLVSGSRHLHAGRRPDSKQASSGLFLGEWKAPSFDIA